MHSNLQEENVDQLHENIEQYQRLQQEEKVTTSDDGRPSHVNIQLFDKYCKGLTDYMHYCKGLLNLCQRVHTEKEQQLDRFCTTTIAAYRVSHNFLFPVCKEYYSN